MNLKNVVKSLINKRYFRFFQKINMYRVTYNAFRYDALRYISHSNSFLKFDTEDKLLGQIIAEYHAIEKGICMPQRRMGFGKQVINNLLDHCMIYLNRYPLYHDQIKHAVAVILEYQRIHHEIGFKLDDDLEEKMSQLKRQINSAPARQLTSTKEAFFSERYSSFDKFSESRHSVRNFTSEPVSLEKIKQSVSLARNSPSSCNRQPSKVYIVQNEQLRRQVLELQNGNRGFGHLATTVLVVTENLSYFLSINERNEAYINGGMFAMNLLYALHFNEIGACPLNWCAEKQNDISLRKLLDIPDNEIIIMLIACGQVPDTFMLASSPRKSVDEIIRIYGE